MSKRGKKRATLAAGLLLILGGFGYLAYGGIGESLVYFVTPSELLGRGEAAYETPVRLNGEVVAGTVEWNAEELDLRFAVTDGVEQVRVHAQGAPPQMFREGIEVVVEGRYTRDGVFESRTLMVKHSNEYRAAPEGHRPADRYQELMREGS